MVCNPPWLPARPSSAVEQAVYDEGSRMLKGFLAGLAAHLSPGGEGWLILSDLAEHLGLRSRDELLELVMGAQVGPRLGAGKLTFVHSYPATQAALARVDAADPRVARRFELYADGIELANGFDELADAAEQRARFEADLRERARRGLPQGRVDERLLAALAAGLPACAGVAVGFDRVLMIACGAAHIDAVLPFALERA